MKYNQDANAAATEIQVEQAETRTELAEARTELAESRTEQAKSRTEQAETRTEQAETRTEQAQTRTEQAEARTELAEARVERAETETELATQASELDYRRLFEAAQDGILILDVNTGRITDVNPYLFQLLGFSRGEMVGKTIGELYPFKNIESNQAMLQRLQQQGHVHYKTLPLETRDGRHISVEFVSNVYEAGDKQLIQCNIRDITERLHAESATALLAAIVESSDDAIIGKDLNGIITSWNTGAEKILGYSAAEMVGNSIMRLIPADRQEEEKQIVGKIQCGESVQHFETVRQAKDGRFINVSVTVSPIKDSTGAVIGASKVAHDITATKQAEEARRASETRYRTLFEYAPDGILIADSESNYVDANTSICQMLGYTHDELIGLNASNIVTLAEFPHIGPALSTIKAESNYHREWQFRRKDGSVFPAEVIATKMPDGNLLAMIDDITERKRLEAQFIQAQKMEVIGNLAGGVAHDFNNMLGVIMGYGEIIMTKLSAESPVRDDVEQIQHAAERALGLTRQLLVFSRKQAVQPVVLNLNATLESLDKMLRQLIDEDIDLQIVPGKELARIKADSGYIGQVLMNLVVNARDAMPNGGKLTIETSNVTLDANYTHTHPEVTSGDYVMLGVSDTGTGMTDEVKTHLFEAFFTTKPLGKGTGLGLATCQTIVQQSGGHMDVYSEVGKGTAFKIYFPRVEQPLGIKVDPIQTGPLPRGTETLLVVEDEPSVRHLACGALQAQGYQVLSATNGQDGLRSAREHTGPAIRLVITDVIMPQMGGKVMADWLKTTYPDLKILFTSGYTDDAIADHGVLDPGVAFLPKPYTLATLTRKVRELLDAP
jgi:PAS domain S-box-containing protein